MREKTVATTCDYCHKPLSLMRRLRGEQFCSVEHLDLYTAQQAEFALQRLAASIEERPAAPRPAALLKRLSRPATEQTMGGEESNHQTLGRADVVVEDAPEEVPSAEFLRVARSLEEPKPVPPLLRRLAQEPPEPPSEQPLVIRPIEEPDYPMAGFVPQDGITVALPQNPSASALPELAAAPLSSAKPRLQIEPQAEPAPAESQSLDLHPADTVIWTGTRADLNAPGVVTPKLPGPEMTTSGPVLVSAPPIAIDLSPRPADLASELGPTAVAPSPQALELPEISEPRLLEDWTPVAAAKVPHSNTFEPAAIAAALLGEDVSSVEFEVPSIFELLKIDLEVAEAAIRPAEFQSSWASSSAVEPGTSAEPATLAGIPEIRPVDALPAVAESMTMPFAPRIPWSPRVLGNVQEVCNPAGPFEPTIGLGWPALASGQSEQPSMASTVALPEFLARVPAEPQPKGNISWVTAAGNWRAPRLADVLPHLSSAGPSFAWEQARPRVGAPISAPQAAPAAAVGVPSVRTGPPQTSVDPTLLEPRTIASTWSRPRQSSASVAPSTERNQEQTLSLRVRELRARVSAKLEAAQARSNADWVAPRTDASGVEPRLAANERPASAGPEVILRPLPNHSVAGLRSVERREQRSLIGRALRLEAIAVALTPVRYSPVSLVVTPQPNYRLGNSTITEEGRFVAQSPKTGSVPVQLRQVGYRMPGPYPKVPRCMPDSYMARPQVQVPTPSPDPIMDWALTRSDAGTLPELETPVPQRVHPADYFKWPSIRSPRADRVLLMKDIQRLLGNVSDGTVPARRFGPSRAGLQAPWSQADEISRAGA